MWSNKNCLLGFKETKHVYSFQKLHVDLGLQVTFAKPCYQSVTSAFKGVAVNKREISCSRLINERGFRVNL
jgi:hypothetical protein